MRLMLLGGLVTSLILVATASHAEEVVQYKNSIQLPASHVSENDAHEVSSPLIPAAYSLNRYILSPDSYKLLRLNAPSKQSIIDKILSDLEPTQNINPITKTASSSQTD